MMPHTIEQLERIRASCKALVKRRALTLAGVALVPIPGIDLLADVGTLSNVIPKINRRFGLTPQQIEELDAHKRNTIHETIKKVSADFVGKSITRGLILAALKRAGRRAIAKRTVKFFPLAGQTIAAAWSYSTMVMIGNAHIDACYRIARAAMDSEGRAGGTFGAAEWSSPQHPAP